MPRTRKLSKLTRNPPQPENGLVEVIVQETRGKGKIRDRLSIFLACPPRVGDRIFYPGIRGQTFVTMTVRDVIWDFGAFGRWNPHPKVIVH